MKTYLDSSALVKLYYPEPESEALALWVRQNGEAIPYTSLHDLELTNVISLKVFRREIRKAQQKAILSGLRADLQNEILERILPNWGEVFSQAAKLSERHAGKLGCRSLDILHVSIALSGGYEKFLTFDKRQIKLAKMVGLKMMNPLK